MFFFFVFFFFSENEQMQKTREVVFRTPLVKLANIPFFPRNLFRRAIELAQIFWKGNNSNL